MKKLLFLVILLLTCTFSYGQLAKGDIQLGGNVSFNSNSNSNADSRSFAINPRVGLLIDSTTSVGLILGYRNSQEPAFVQGAITDLKSTNFAYGVYARFHKPVADKFYLFLQPSLLFGTGTTEQPANGDLESSSWSINLIPGMLYFVSPRFAIELSLGRASYARAKFEQTGAEFNSSAFSFNTSFTSVGLGLSYYIR